MARINVENDLLIHPRFAALVARLGGDTEKALGRLVRFWFAAQRRWADNRASIPKDEFELGGFEYLLEVGFAVEKDGGVLARASEDQFDWIHDKRQAASEGGRKSAESRRQKYGSADPRISGSKREAPLHDSGSTPEAPVKHSGTDVNAHTPTHTPTHIKALSDDNAMSSSGRRPGPDPRKLAELWNELRASTQPEVDAKHFKPGSRRWRAAQARFSEQADLGYWRQVVERIARSAFCRGEVESRDGRKAWVANFDFLVRAESHLKVMEGRYDDRSQGAATVDGKRRERGVEVHAGDALFVKSEDDE